MSAIAQQESYVKESLFKFINKNVPTANIKTIDEIVLSYVIAVLEEASRDPVFDVLGFIDMMTAYVPDFSRLNVQIVCCWVLQLEAELSSRVGPDSHTKNEKPASADKISLALENLSDMLPAITKPTRSHSNSESSEGAEGGRRAVVEDEHASQCAVLHEMFPNTCAMEIKHCLSIAHGDVEHAAATLLHRREQGQAMSTGTLHTAAKQPLCDDHELKNRIIARYSYVDKNSGTKEHKPLAPKNEPKKMVRYRDNKIVSLKGERYTEVPKSGADEEQLKKPKKQHSP